MTHTVGFTQAPLSLKSEGIRYVPIELTLIVEFMKVLSYILCYRYIYEFLRNFKPVFSN